MPTNSPQANHLAEVVFSQLFFGSGSGLNKIIPFWGVAVFFFVSKAFSRYIGSV